MQEDANDVIERSYVHRGRELGGRSSDMAGVLQFGKGNRLITVLSPGKDQVYDPNLAGDDLVGFRLRRLGNKGK